MRLGGLEILAICAIMGGLLGIAFRDKKRGAWVGFVVGAVGAIITTYLLIELIFASYLAMPVYAILGSWLFNLLFKKVFK